MRYRKLRIALIAVFAICGLIAAVIFIFTALDYRETTPETFVYQYENADGTFFESEVPFKGHTFEMVQQSFGAFKAKYSHPDDQLYITEKIKPHDKSGAHPRWKLPYKEPTTRN